LTLQRGARLGPYEILAPLGRGGMGEVYKARDTRLGREVAVKVLPEHLTTNPELRQRFEREARALCKLQHPRVCTLHDVGSERGIDFLVMEQLEGETLEARLRRGALPTTQSLELGGQIAEGIDAAHRRGLVPRDLKPANVMLTASGAKVLDFGLAREIVPEQAAASDSAGDHAWLAHGIAEELIEMLSLTEALQVVARTSAHAAKQTGANAGAIGALLNVGAIVEGSVRSAGDELRVTVQLIRVADGFHLWSGRYDETLEDVFAIQEEIGREVAEALRAELGVAADTVSWLRRARYHPRDVRAYELGRKGVEETRRPASSRRASAVPSTTAGRRSRWIPATRSPSHCEPGPSTSSAGSASNRAREPWNRRELRQSVPSNATRRTAAPTTCSVRSTWRRPIGRAR
jgi:serine/threonine protein kinase